jgi:Fe-S oxidoreductase
MWLEESIGRRINVTRVEQALPHAPRVIATACPYCAVMMADGVSALGKAEEIAVHDIAELVATSMRRTDVRTPVSSTAGAGSPARSPGTLT